MNKKKRDKTLNDIKLKTGYNNEMLSQLRGTVGLPHPGELTIQASLADIRNRIIAQSNESPKPKRDLEDLSSLRAISEKLDNIDMKLSEMFADGTYQPESAYEVGFAPEILEEKVTYIQRKLDQILTSWVVIDEARSFPE